MKPTLICLYGETCAGKSTLGKNLSERLGCRYISFGDLKRDEIKQHTRLGAQLQFLLDRECPIPAELGYEVIKGTIEDDILNIVSGYPISIDEFRVMSRSALVVGVIELCVDELTLIMRLGTRRECPVCHFPGVIGDVCPRHNTNMTRRDDVGIDELLKRRRLYHQRIEPFLQLEEIRQIPNLRLDSTLAREDVASQAEMWINSTLNNRRRE